MLLRHTSSEVLERKALTLNPAKTCQPIGALYASLGIHKCMPHSHGSQGCCAYHRSTLTRHYKEPVLAATSSFTEGSSVFGGQANLLQAIANIFNIYDPEVIAIHTTCLSETIGDDIPQIVSKARDVGSVPKGKTVIHANTPSYAGSHVTGFSNMAAGIVNYLAESTLETKNDRLNIVPGWVEPCDMREIKRLVAAMGVDFQMALDTSGVLDTPMTGKAEMYPKGGVTVEQAKTLGDSRYTLALGPSASDAAGRALENKCGVPCETLELPIGLQATDRFIHRIHQLYHVEVPEIIRDERGRLLDLMIDMGQVLSRKAVWPSGRSGPAGLAFRVSGGSGHASRLHRDRNTGQAVRTSHHVRSGRKHSGGEGGLRRGRRHVPDAPVDQERPGGSADRQHLRQVHRPG
jgi:nitrogenase molybdenum-iron protein beta chain